MIYSKEDLYEINVATSRALAKMLEHHALNFHACPNRFYDNPEEWKDEILKNARFLKDFSENFDKPENTYEETQQILENASKAYKWFGENLSSFDD